MLNAIESFTSTEIIIWFLVTLNALIGVGVLAILGRSKRLADLQREVTDLRAAISGNTQNADLIDRRLIQLLTQTSDDAASLRENLVERVEQVRLQLSHEMSDERSRSQSQANDLKEQLRSYLASNQRTLEVRHNYI